MIPMMNIVAWSNVVPWAELRQVEQDLTISRAIIELFPNSFLASRLRFRGGTVLKRLHFPVPMRIPKTSIWLGRARGRSDQS
jgi:hypothetical protein